MVKRIRQFLQNFLLAVLSIVIVLGFFEMTARTLIKLRVLKKYTPMQTLLSGTEDWRRTHLTTDNRREPDPVLFWRSVPRYPYNSQRFKGPVAVISKPPSVFRIICYGDSNTDGSARGGWPINR